jgi:hypothetical protein
LPGWWRGSRPVGLVEGRCGGRRSRETIYQAIDRYRVANHAPSVDHPPDVSGAGLSDMQLDGLACIVCGRGEDEQPMRPAGFGPRGQVFRHDDCADGVLRDTEA